MYNQYNQELLLHPARTRQPFCRTLLHFYKNKPCTIAVPKQLSINKMKNKHNCNLSNIRTKEKLKVVVTSLNEETLKQCSAV